jgi:hypothetical protein
MSSLPARLAAIHCEPLPISPVAPVPSCVVKPPILFGSVGLPAELLLNHLMTRLLKSLGRCSLHVPALACAQREAAGAHYLGFPLFPLKIDREEYCIGFGMTEDLICSASCQNLNGFRG